MGSGEDEHLPALAACHRYADNLLTTSDPDLQAAAISIGSRNYVARVVGIGLLARHFTVRDSLPISQKWIVS